ncbi:MAG: amidohydrolase family protein [Bacteroidota bacterium]
MYKIFFSILFMSTTCVGYTQENMHPAPKQAKPIVIQNATIHNGNGKVLEGAYLVIENGKIKALGTGTVTSIPGAEIIDASGKHVYPGIIAASTNLGLVEVSTVRAGADYQELGDLNPNIHSIVAYNTDSKVINTLRSNGVLLAHIVPAGGAIRGSSSVVQLDAWNWEDAAYKIDNGVHFNMPVLLNRPNQFRRRGSESVDLVKLGLDKLEEARKFFREASAYNKEKTHTAVNLKYAGVQGLFDQSQTFFVHCDLVREMMVAIDLANEFGFKLVIIGGSDSWLIPDILKKNNVAVILSEPHSLPATDDDDVDQPYKTGAALQKAGVLFTICQDNGSGYWQQRNLPFQAGTMAAYGLTKEEALTAVTLSAAKILGIEEKAGSLEVGKDANIVISEGDLLDMKSSKVSQAFIQGRMLNLDNKQTQLYEKYKYKYDIK